jgi:hypothetical protein
MNRRVIQIGDHSPEYVAVVIDPFQQRMAELFAVRKLDATSAELFDLARRGYDEARRLRSGVIDENFARVRSASIDLTEIAKQLQFLVDGLNHAVAEASNGSPKP